VIDDKPYQDASGRSYLAMFAQPVLVLVGSHEQLSFAYSAVAHQVRLGIFTEELFATDNDDDNRAAVAAVPRRRAAAGRAGPARPATRGRHGPRACGCTADAPQPCSAHGHRLVAWSPASSQQLFEPL
jgi:hypothetical protein